jgi:hypothetical protein
VLLWSLASVSHAFAWGMLGFLAARMALGAGEGAGFPGAVRTVAQTLPLEKRRLSGCAPHSFDRHASSSRVGLARGVLVYGRFGRSVAGAVGRALAPPRPRADAHCSRSAFQRTAME